MTKLNVIVGFPFNYLQCHSFFYSTILVEPCCEASITKKGDIVIQVGFPYIFRFCQHFLSFNMKIC